MSDIGLEISKVLFREEPTLLACDADASGRAALALSNVMGCIMATVLIKHGEDVYLEAMRLLMTKANEMAHSTAQKAFDKIDARGTGAARRSH